MLRHPWHYTVCVALTIRNRQVRYSSAPLGSIMLLPFLGGKGVQLSVTLKGPLDANHATGDGMQKAASLATSNTANQLAQQLAAARWLVMP